MDGFYVSPLGREHIALMPYLENMRVLHISTSDRKGGAASSAYRLHTALNKKGISSSMYVLRRTVKDPSVDVYRPLPGFFPMMKRYLVRNNIKRDFLPYKSRRSEAVAEYYSDDRSPEGLYLPALLPAADIINLHWVSEFLDHTSFFARKSINVPVVWRLSDMNPFTGGCHYNEGCERFLIGCGKCPQLVSDEELDLSRRIFERKKKALSSFNSDQMHIIAQSKWIAGEIRRSPILGAFTVHEIPNGIDSDVFFPRNKTFSKDVLGIPAKNRVVLFVADSTLRKRKGFDLLLGALRRMHDIKDLTLLVTGAFSRNFMSDLDCRFLGEQKDNRFLSVIYSAADIFVISSRQDNLPNTVLEAMACGTPVAGFAVGGIPDMVRQGQTGWLAEPENMESLSDVIRKGLANSAERELFSGNARKLIEKEYSLDLQVQRYTHLYQSLLMQKHAAVNSKS